MMKDDDYLLATLPSEEDLKLFAETGSNGPDPFDLRWDFDHPASSDWNQVVIGILVLKLSELREEEQWTTAPKSHAYWVEAITQKFNRIRTVVSKARPRVLGGHLPETDHQLADRLIRARDESLKKARRDARRVMVSECFTSTVFIVCIDRKYRNTNVVYSLLNSLSKRAKKVACTRTSVCGDFCMMS